MVGGEVVHEAETATTPATNYAERPLCSAAH